jgi:hypothetical protein
MADATREARRDRLAAVGLLLAILAAGCKSTSSDVLLAGDAGDAGDADASHANAPFVPHLPAHHRAAAAACAPVAPPAEPGASSVSASPCKTHADCTAKPNGRCVARTGGGPAFNDGNRCLYDECTTDDTCPTGDVCVCSGDDASLCKASVCNCNSASKACVVQSRSDDNVCSCGAANVCMKGNCRVDSDCGAGGYCSPAIDACNQFFGYYCHIAADECSDETDCPISDQRICTPVAATGGASTNTKWICSAASSCP